MRKILLCAVLLCAVLTGAFSSGNRQAAGSAGGSEPTVRLLTDATGIDDKSFNAAAWRGILQFYGDTWENARQRGSLYDVITAQTQDMYIPNLRQATDEAYDLIAVTGFTWEAALKEVATQNPRQKYLIVDIAGIGLPNVLEVVFAEHEGSFLVGAAAALKAKADGIVNPKFGFIGGIASPTITKFEVGFIQGVLSVLPNAQIVDYYVNSWGEPSLAKIQAKNWYDSGVYTIFSAAGGSGNGAIAQAKEYRLAGQNIWAIGVDSDQHEEGIYRGNESAILTSMLKKVETSMTYGLDAIKKNTFKGEIVTLDLKTEGVGYSTTNPAMTADITGELERLKQRIISGQIKVADTYADAKQIPGFPQNLMAKDTW